MLEQSIRKLSMTDGGLVKVEWNRVVEHQQLQRPIMVILVRGGNDKFSHINRQVSCTVVVWQKETRM